ASTSRLQPSGCGAPSSTTSPPRAAISQSPSARIRLRRRSASSSTSTAPARSQACGRTSRTCTSSAPREDDRPQQGAAIRALECRSVSSARGLAAWIALTDTLYADAPQFIPPTRQQLRQFQARKAPYFKHGDIELLSVLRDGTVVARTTAHTNAKLDAKLGVS